MKDDRVLLAALRKFSDQAECPASHFTPAQRTVLDRFVRQTGALSCQAQGRGDTYRILNAALFETHLKALSPGLDGAIASAVPLRAQHIAAARDSKAGVHRHERYYLMLKAVGEGVVWRDSVRGMELPLVQATRQFGVAALAIEPSDAWSSDGELWLVENQALFDVCDWLPPGTNASVAYYGGQINGLLLSWLGRQARAGQLVHFPDYDGVGLVNFSRLHAVLGSACRFWLMPDWALKLNRYGSAALWQDTLREFTSASQSLSNSRPDDVAALMEHMRQSGRALEQEAVWLPVGAGAP
jgi:hypothetical protein